MNIHTFYFNPYRECTYVVSEGKECFIIDPGMYGERECQRLQDYLRKEELTPKAVLITHAHPDHICGLEWMQEQWEGIPVYGKIYQQPTDYTLLGHPFTIMATPGHKEDAVCYYFAEEKVLFTGDTLFQESIGRTDLPGGDTGELMNSLKRLAALPNDTQVYPGHGYPTTIEHEKDYNPYM